jgi:hypothetical protein
MTVKGRLGPLWPIIAQCLTCGSVAEIQGDGRKMCTWAERHARVNPGHRAVVDYEVTRSYKVKGEKA